MGILDDAIKEHLELKRQHGADQSELKQLEDEAFGAAERPGSERAAPDAEAEAPTQFMEQPDLPESEEGSGRQPRVDIADLQEAPQAEEEDEDAPTDSQALANSQAPDDLPEPAEEQAPAMEHEAIAAPEARSEPSPESEPEPSQPSSSHSTEERHAIAEQPTEMFDVEEELAATDAKAPSEEEIVEEEIAEPRLAPVDPLSGLQDAADEDAAVAGLDSDASLDEEFWDEKRLSDELDQALEAPIESEPEAQAEPTPPAEPESATPDPEPKAEEPEPEQPEAARLEHTDEDVLEETPDFLEEAPEDDRLWFEQKPPKDFDFDD